MRLKPRHLILYLVLIQGTLYGQTADTSMTVDFQVTTSSPGGNFSPRNIGAIWVESNSGTFVKTLRVWGSRRRQYLYTWNSRSEGNTVDGVTGATMTSHGLRTASWDFTDVNGDTVAPGDYTLRLELTDQHAQGPLYSFSFPFMGSTEAISPPEQTNFHSMSMTYHLTFIVGLDGEPRMVPDRLVLEQNSPNPFNPSTTIRFVLNRTGTARLTIYDLEGRHIVTLLENVLAAGEHQLLWDGRNDRGGDIQSGVYLCRLNARGETRTIKMLYLK